MVCELLVDLTNVLKKIKFRIIDYVMKLVLGLRESHEKSCNLEKL